MTSELGDLRLQPAHRNTLALLTTYVSACVLLIIWVVHQPPIHRGDGFEYLLTVEAFSNHQSPNLVAQDLDDLRAALENSGIPPHVSPDMNFYDARDGLRLGWHFWLYSLLATPIRDGLEMVGADPLAALQVLNATALALATGIAIFAGPKPLRARLLYLGLVLVSPVWWFLRWPHPEVFTWSCGIVGVALFRARRPSAAAFAASLGAMQNPPLVFLALGIVLLTGFDEGWRRARLPLLSVAPAALPPLFSSWAFGTPSLIVSKGIAGWQFVSGERVASLLFDFNQGMLPHIPWLLALWLVTGTSVILRRDGRGMLVFALLAPMLLMAATQGNWNGGTAGIMRYTIWMIPLMGWLVVDHLALFRGRDLVIGCAIAAQVPLLMTRGNAQDYVDHSPLAHWALSHAPMLYSPLPEIFIERTVGRELLEPGELDAQLPVAYARADDVVTKVAYRWPVRVEDWSRFEVDPAYLRRLAARPADEAEICYDEPPPGAVRLRAASTP